MWSTDRMPVNNSAAADASQRGDFVEHHIHANYIGTGAGTTFRNTGAARDVTESLARLEQAALRRVATVVAHGAAPTEVFQAVAGEVAVLVDCDVTLIGRYEHDSAFSYLASGGAMPAAELGDRLRLGGNNLASAILRSGQSESMSYDHASGPIGAFAHTLGIRSAVGAPIVVEDRIWGAMIAG
jgi:transcriptional regulator with GAF, ATPase, and Fis domain